MKTERGRGEEGQEQQRVRMIESGGERAGRKKDRRVVAKGQRNNGSDREESCERAEDSSRSEPRYTCAHCRVQHH